MVPKILKENLQNRTSSYNLRKCSSFYVKQVHSVYCGTESLSFVVLRIGELVPDDVKQSESLDIFKSKINN